MTALVAAGRGVYRVDGSPRMRQRPIQDLLDGLAALGVRARSEAGTGCPPVRIETAGLSGGEVCVSGSVSSQFVSALLMAAPAAARPVTIRVTGPLVSKPYVDMTLAVMAHFDCRLKIEDCRMQNAEQHQEPCVSSGLLPEFCNLQSAICIHVPAPAVYRACRYVVEPDASSASYFLAAAAATGGQVTVEGLWRDSAQGDVRFAEVLQEMGCEVAWGPQGVTVKGPAALRGVQVDLGAMPDMVLTLAPLALLARGRTVIRNVANLRVKESDRLAALAAELARLGAQVRQFPDGLEILPPETIRPAEVATYNDHRMAMGMSIVGLARPGVAIAGAECVSKTYPGFFEDLERLTEQQ
jgi:3-phosphoshikimate 1-carboxyvinyltransferase